MKEHAGFAGGQEVLSLIMMLGVEGDSAFIIEKSTQTLYHFRKEAAGIQLVHRYSLKVGRKTTEYFPPSIGKLPEGVYFPKSKIRSADIQLLLESMPLEVFQETFQMRLYQKEGEGMTYDADPEDFYPPFPLVIQNGLSNVIGQINSTWTPFVVVNDITYSPEGKVQNELQDILGFIKNWESCEETLNLDCYMLSYSKEFQHEATDWHGWKAYKGNLFSQKIESRTTLKPIHVIQNGTWALLTFLQDYRSPDYRDLGIKQIVIRREGSEWKIIREEWRPYEVRS
jgi:hypothetical protein